MADPWRPRFVTSSLARRRAHTSVSLSPMPPDRSMASMTCQFPSARTKRGRWTSGDRPRHQRHLRTLPRAHPEPRVITWLEGLTDDVAITTITLAELLAGVRRLPAGRRRDELESVIEAAVRPYRDTRSLLAFDEAAATQYAEVLAMRAQAGLPISTADAQIAAICRGHRAVCATRNTRDLAKTGVEVANPWTECGR